MGPIDSHLLQLHGPILHAINLTPASQTPSHCWSIVLWPWQLAVNHRVIYHLPFDLLCHVVLVGGIAGYEPPPERKYLLSYVCSKETQISLRTHAVWSEPSLGAWRNFAPLAIQNAQSEDSDQTARIAHVQSDLILRWAHMSLRTYVFWRLGSHICCSCVHYVQNHALLHIYNDLFVCVKILRPNHSNWVMSSTVSLPTTLLLGGLRSLNS